MQHEQDAVREWHVLSENDNLNLNSKKSKDEFGDTVNSISETEIQYFKGMIYWKDNALSLYFI